MENTDQKNKHKMVNAIHLWYSLSIALIIIICVIVTQHYSVCEAAFTNFSFAATITSIVLAVVSIVYSIKSENGVADNLGAIRGIENNIHEQLKDFSELEERLTRKIEDSNDKMKADIQDSVNQSIEAVSSRIPDISWKGNGTATEGTYNVSKSTLFGCLVLYACMSAYRSSKKRMDMKCLSPVVSKEFIKAFVISLNAAVDDVKFSADVAETVVTIHKLDTVYFKEVESVIKDKENSFKDLDMTQQGQIEKCIKCVQAAYPRVNN